MGCGGIGSDGMRWVGLPGWGGMSWDGVDVIFTVCKMSIIVCNWSMRPSPLAILIRYAEQAKINFQAHNVNTFSYCVIFLIQPRSRGDLGAPFPQKSLKYAIIHCIPKGIVTQLSDK